MGKLKESGSGGSKKDAKREAAQKMIDKLKDLGPNSSEQVPTSSCSEGLKPKVMWGEKK